MSRSRDDAAYPFRMSPAEIERLACQSARFDPATRRLLADAGIGPGMRVLDVGCGVGDSSRLVAALVGPGGAVVGVNADPGVLAVARGRPAAAPLDLVAG